MLNLFTAQQVCTKCPAQDVQLSNATPAEHRSCSQKPDRHQRLQQHQGSPTNGTSYHPIRGSRESPTLDTLPLCHVSEVRLYIGS